MSFWVIGGGAVTYVDGDEPEEHAGVQLRIYVPRA